MESYWDKRFSIEGMIWGEEPSKTAYHAFEVFKAYDINSILIPGSGYGRNTKSFSANFSVTGIELSQEAISLAKKWDLNSRFIQGSVLDPIKGKEKYDAVYCYDVLHLFLEQDRKKLIQESCFLHVFQMRIQIMVLVRRSKKVLMNILKESTLTSFMNTPEQIEPSFR